MKKLSLDKVSELLQHCSERVSESFEDLRTTDFGWLIDIDDGNDIKGSLESIKALLEAASDELQDLCEVVEELL
jgi:hypothetical protein